MSRVEFKNSYLVNVAHFSFFSVKKQNFSEHFLQLDWNF